jgi:competence transcription factor ComK
MLAFVEVTFLEQFYQKVSDEFSPTFLLNVNTIRSVLRHGEFTSIKLDNGKIITVDISYHDFKNLIDKACKRGGVAFHI